MDTPSAAKKADALTYPCPNPTTALKRPTISTITAVASHCFFVGGGFLESVIGQKVQGSGVLAVSLLMPTPQGPKAEEQGEEGEELDERHPEVPLI